MGRHTLGPALARSAYNESHDDSGPLAHADSPPASRILGRPDLDLGRTGSLSDPGRDSVLVRKAARLAVAIICAGDRSLRGRAVSRDGVSAQCPGSCGRWNRAVVSRAEDVGIAPPAHSRSRPGAGRAHRHRSVGLPAERLLFRDPDRSPMGRALRSWQFRVFSSSGLGPAGAARYPRARRPSLSTLRERRALALATGRTAAGAAAALRGRAARLYRGL